VLLPVALGGDHYAFVPSSSTDRPSISISLNPLDHPPYGENRGVNRVSVTTANRCSTRQREVFPAALAFFHLALAAAEIRARPSALILRLLLAGVASVPFILAHLARAAAAILALPAADIRRRFLPVTAGVVVSPKMDASCVSSRSICSLIATALRSCATLKLLRGVIKALVVRHSRDWVNERDCLA